ncbi:MAG: glucose-6-phosphate isomerase [Planktomarina sp.]
MWQHLQSLHAQKKDQRITELFNKDRARDFSTQFDGLLYDYAKTNIDHETRDALLTLLNQANVPAVRDAMFAGVKINDTENRAVLHTALRRKKTGIFVDGKDVMPGVLETKKRFLKFAEDVRSGAFQGAGGKITDVINIGIGGSDLGPLMAKVAMTPYHDGPRCHFVSNVDPAHFTDLAGHLDPKNTLVIVASKAFTTMETLANAEHARNWMAKAVDTPTDQFVALSSNLKLTAEYGIAPERVFGFEDWVGGRYSIWGPIGLSLAIGIGPKRFQEFLDGALAMDEHFCSASGADNMPFMLALVGIWHAQLCNYESRAIIPFEQRLDRLPAYLQQLEMESNGKTVAKDGSAVPVRTGPIIWGKPGTNGQHAFFQLLHQGNHFIPCEFFVGREGHEPEHDEQHKLLQASCLAQSKALMVGRDIDKARRIAAAKGYKGAELERQAKHRVFDGNRPSTTLCYPKLTPYVLGQILALYEHRVFVEGVILGINSFDQWGVELGKELTSVLQPVMKGAEPEMELDGSTTQLVDYLRF